MDCPVCGRPYPCAHSRRTTSALKAVVRESEAGASSDQEETVHLPSPSEVQRRADQELWRREVASRVRQHRARRRRRFDPNASFEFDFPADTALAIAPVLPAPPSQIVGFEEEDRAASSSTPWAAEVAASELAPRKVIRFPRPGSLSSPDFVDALELAEPLQPAPRILDSPEPQQLELLPTFPDIRLDEEPGENQVEPIDLPPQPASLPQRVLSAIVDSAVLLFAGGAFIAVFRELTGVLPFARPMLPYALIGCVAFWSLFQYVFLVFGRRTPGMLATGLELCTFAGQPASVKARRNRALAATLSALSGGLGFLCQLVDDDTLRWHDRICETYLLQRIQQSAFSNRPDR